MKKLMIALGLLFGLSVMSMSSAAAPGRSFEQANNSWICQIMPRVCNAVREFVQEHRGGDRRRDGARAVPEIDAAGAAIALALTAGVISISRERRKKR